MAGTLRFLFLATRLLVLRRFNTAHVLKLQQRRLRQLLHHAQAHSAFYRQRLRGLDLNTCRLAEVPPLTKAELMAHFDELVTDPRIKRANLEAFVADPDNLGRYYLDRYAIAHTSGSQGQPALVVQERLDVLRNGAVHLVRSQRLSRLPPVRLLCSRLFRRTRTAVFTQRAGFYPSGSNLAYLAAARLPGFQLLRLSVFDPIQDTVARLNEFQPHFLLGYASGLETLAREESEGRLRLRQGGQLRQITSLSEPLLLDARERIEQAFGVHVADLYSMAECPALSSGCPVGPGSHLNADLACLEVVDENYRPVPDGVPGSKVLVTNLTNHVQPLIRYEIGDVVTMSPSPCPCGSNLPLIQAVEGRTLDKFWIQVNGSPRPLPYYVFLAGLHHCLELAEHQVLQTAPNHFVVRVAPRPGESVSVERVRKVLDDIINLEGLKGLFEVEVQTVAHINPDPRSGKMKRVQSLIGPPPGLR